MLWRSRRIPAFLGVCLLGALSGVDGAEPLRLHVTPTVAFAPAFVRVQTSIEADAKNRLLEVVAASSDYYQSSEIEIDGAQAPRTSIFEFQNLPPGRYEFTAILTGTDGTRATVFQAAEIASRSGR
jgi:hypothetical protein